MIPTPEELALRRAWPGPEPLELVLARARYRGPALADTELLSILQRLQHERFVVKRIGEHVYELHLTSGTPAALVALRNDSLTPPGETP